MYQTLDLGHIKGAPLSEARGSCRPCSCRDLIPMGNSSSTQLTPENVWKAAASNNAQALRNLLQQVPQGQQRTFIEYQDELGWTPLMVAAAKNCTQTTDQLLRFGANVHHAAASGATTPLHEAVIRNAVSTTELLLKAGANPFLENGQGLTSVDIAINNKSVAMVRRLESGAAFVGWLDQKAPKYILGSEWAKRWCVVSPRFPSPASPQRQQMVRSLLVIYKSQEMTNPCCKVWLDGARAATQMDRPDRPLRCLLALHRTHAAPSGAFLSGDPSVGFSLHFQAPSSDKAAAEKLQRFMTICNGGSQAIAFGTNAYQHIMSRGGGAAAQPARPAQAPQPPPMTTVTLGTGPLGTGAPSMQLQQQPTTAVSADEEYARRLQAQFDADVADLLIDAVPDAELPAAAGSAFGGSPPARSQPSTPQSARQEPEIRYPTIPPAAPHSQGSPDLASAAAPPATATEQGASQPAASAPQPQQPAPAGHSYLSFDMPPAAAPPSGAVPGGALESDDEQCVICLDRKAEAGFLHGSSVHKCCCRECAAMIGQQPNKQCPVCRQPIQHVIMNFF